MIVRELLSIFGIEYDQRGQRRAERGLQALKSQVDSIAGAAGQIFGAFAIASPFLGLVKMASDAQENLNLLELAFGDNAQEIVEWSNTAGPAMGRSRYTMRELAAEFGGLLQPMVGTNDQLKEMSTNLAALAVDLSSARNVTENEALSALQSGLAGNIIAMKRFGVNLNQARVQQEAMRRGLSKNTKDLKQGELASIRYSIIMEDLKFLLGDAKATQFMFANSVRATRDALKDIGTELGFFLLPAAEDILNVFRKMLRPLQAGSEEFKKLNANTNLAHAAFAGLALVMGALLLPIFLKLLPFLLVFGMFALVIDDVMVAFQGGDSALLEFAKHLDKLEKDGFPGMSKEASFGVKALNRFRDALGLAAVGAYTLGKGLVTGDWKEFKEVLEMIVFSLEDMMGMSFEEIGDQFDPLLKVLDALKTAFKFLANEIGKAYRNADKFAQSIGMGKAGDLVTSTVGDTGKRLVGGIGNALGFGSEPKKVSARGKGGNVVNHGGNNTQITIQQQPGEDSEDLAKRVQDIIAMEREAEEEALYRSGLVQTAEAAQ